MISHSTQNDRGVCRHELTFVSPAAWRSILETRKDLVDEPLVAGWVDQGWPLVVRRFAPGETEGLPLGLPLPPCFGKRRLSFLVQPEDVISFAQPPLLSVANEAAPSSWTHTLNQVTRLAAEHGVEARVFGSLGWQTLTGLDYLTNKSDLDVLLTFPRGTDVAALTNGLAEIEAAAPMRVDGELVREDGAAVNWRELHSGAREVLVKTTRGVTLLSIGNFLNGGGIS